MAVEAKSKERALKIKVHMGSNDKGNPVYGTRTLGSVKLDASNDDLLAIATGAGDLITYDL